MTATMATPRKEFNYLGGKGALRNSSCAGGEFAARGRREGFTVSPIEFDRLFHDLAKLGEHGPLIQTMAAAIDESRSAAHVALVLLRPLDDLHISSAVLHRFVPSTTARTDFT